MDKMEAYFSRVNIGLHVENSPSVHATTVATTNMSFTCQMLIPPKPQVTRMLVNNSNQ